MTWHTEDEAKKRWCPMSRDSNTGGNRGQASEQGRAEPERFMCIASSCMAWRWAEPAAEANACRGGYCGLAGEALRP